jgi:hypothetical protein
MMPRAGHLADRLGELQDRKFDKEMDELMKMPLDDLRKLYDTRDIEPEDEIEKDAVAAGSKEIND